MRPGRRQHAVEPGDGRVGQRGQWGAAQAERISREHARAAAVGEDGDALAAQGFGARQSLGRDKQIARGGDPQGARASERRVINLVRSGERAGMQRGGSGAFRRTARLDHDDRLVARGRARRRHEFAGMLDGFDIHQDRRRLRIRGEIIEHIAEVDVGGFAERDEMRKSDLACTRPIEQRGGQCAGLGHECQVARQGGLMRKTGVEPDMR